MDRRARGRYSNVHGSAGYDDRECGLASYRWRIIRCSNRWRMGYYKLSRGECHHPSDFRLALGSSRPAQLFSLVNLAIHNRLSVVRNGDEFEYAYCCARAARLGRRRIATFQSRRVARRFPERETRRSHDDVWNRRVAGTSCRSDTRRLHHR